MRVMGEGCGGGDGGSVSILATTSVPVEKRRTQIELRHVREPAHIKTNATMNGCILSAQEG